jgi:gamma-aminobutyric acid type B receptor
MTSFGTLVMASAIIPLSMDDEKFTKQGCNIACMAAPWLFSVGFVITFSALFSKTWRVNKVFHNPTGFQRIRVTESDVLTPFAILLTANVIVLLCWTFLAPLEFHRQPHSGTDNWNRVYKSFYGSCLSKNGDSMVYCVLLGLINVCALIIANFQAYQARHIHVEFSESQYIGMVMVCMLQAFLVGAPVLLLMQENPVSTYIVQSILIFFTAFSILVFIFVPKVLRMSDLNNKSPLNKKHSSKSFQTSDTEGCEMAAGAKFKLMKAGAPQSTAIRESVTFVRDVMEKSNLDKDGDTMSSPI